MGASSSNEFQLVVPETDKRARADLFGFTVPCRLSPEINAVYMEIRWFKETDCVCVYKNRHMIEGRSYEGRVRQFTEKLYKGDVSLSLKLFSDSDVGDYVCQVTCGDRTGEITVRVKKSETEEETVREKKSETEEETVREKKRETDPKYFLSRFMFARGYINIEEINRTWTEEERLEMESSALMSELIEKSKNPEDLKNFITEKDTKIKHLEEHKERLFVERDQLIQEKDNILLENKQTLEMKDKELETCKHQLEILRNELQEVKLQLDKQKTKFNHQEKILQEHKQQKYDEEIKKLYSEVEGLKNESSKRLAELNEKCLEDTEKLLTVKDTQIKDLEKSKETALEEKDRLLYNSNDKLQQTTKEAEEKQREIEEKNKLMTEKEKLLENTVKELETSKHQLDTLRNKLQDTSSQLQLVLEENKLLKNSAGKEMPVSTEPVRRNNSMELDPPYMSEETASVFVPASELRLVLLGSAGCEKSSAGNIILNREKIQTHTLTETQQSEIRQEEVDGKQVTVVETPDWFCSELSLEEVRQDVRRCIHLSAPGPHAFLLVIPVHQSTGVERDMMEKMEEILGERCWMNTLILFTVTDEKQKKNIEDFVQSENQEIQRLLEKCGNRFHCLNIHQNEDGSQISELLEKIEKMMEGNTERFYSSEIYLEVESQIRAMERKIMRDKEDRKEREEREMKERIEKEVQNSLRKIEGMIEEHEGDIKQLNERTGELERQMREERDEEKKKELQRELEKEVQKRIELEKNINKLKDQREREKSEMEERHRQEMEEIRQKYGEIRLETEKNLMKVILSKLQRNILDSKLKMQRGIIRQMQEKNSELEILKKKLSELNESYFIMSEFHESALKNLKSS